MILVIVEHFLNEAGRQYFSRWLEEIETVLKNYEGFQSIEQIQKIEEPESVHLLMHFSSIDLLRKWAKSQEHDDMLGRLKPFMVQKQKSLIFQKK